MLRKTGRYFLLLCFILFFAVIPLTAEAVPKITADELNNILGTEDLVVIDSRKTSDWEKSEEMILGAFRGDPWKTEEWIADLSPDKRYVVYCA